MEEINQLIEKLKKDQEVLYDDFKEQVLRAYSGQQKKYKDENFESLKNIIVSIFGIPDLFSKTRLQKYVAARSCFDYNLRLDGYTLKEIGAETNRDHSTVFHSIKNYETLKNVTQYKTKYESIINLYAKYKSESCDVCGSKDIIEGPSMGLNCNRCNPL